MECVSPINSYIASILCLYQASNSASIISLVAKLMPAENPETANLS